ncbi:RNA polymerase sigma factor [Spongiimicrobium salis]|uniref:RNA polymerase sigma factor n=1 Tax=Spongiimicrobium salis TaxID=1667022 RepID=UPI00374DE39A
MQDSLTRKLTPEHWVSRYHHYFLNYVRSRVSSEYEAEEIVQETFLSALKSIENYRKKASEKTWLLSILRHKIIDYYRKGNTMNGATEKYMISHEDYKEIYHAEFGDPSFFSKDYIEKESYLELKSKVLLNLKRLPYKQSEVFKMKVFNEFETDTICEKLNISRDYAWVLMCRAKKQLSSSLREEFV